MNMKTILVSAAAAATLLAGSATSASAQTFGGNPYWGRPYARMSSVEFFRQLRACQRHARVHRELNREHRYEHDEGLYSRGDHRDLHGALGEAHDRYHYDHPRADFCDGIILSSRYRNPYRYWMRNYGNRDYGYGFGGYWNGGRDRNAYDDGYGSYGSGYSGEHVPHTH